MNFLAKNQRTEIFYLIYITTCQNKGCNRCNYLQQNFLGSTCLRHIIQRSLSKCLALIFFSTWVRVYFAKSWQIKQCLKWLSKYPFVCKFAKFYSIPCVCYYILLFPLFPFRVLTQELLWWFCIRPQCNGNNVSSFNIRRNFSYHY